MAKKEAVVKAVKDAPEAEGKGQGRAVTLPNGARRIDFIRDAYYKEGKTRSDIRKEINALYEEGADGQIPYQIVFAATKTGEQGNAASDPRLVPKEPKEAKEEVKK